MKHFTNLRWLIMSFLLAVGVSSAWGDTVTLQYSTNSTTSMTGNNDAATLGLSATDWSVIGYKGSSQNMPGLNKDGSIRLYGNASGGNYITVSSLSGATISSISITYTGNTYNNGVVSVNGNTVTGSNGTYNINSSSFTLTNGNTSTTQVRVSSIVITYSSGSSAVATTTTIDPSGITNTDRKNGTVAGSLSATVKDNGNNTISNPEVTWSGDNDDVATINATTGAVTLVSDGTVHFTASYAGIANQYNPSSATYEMTVTDTRYSISNLTFNSACGGSGTADDEAAWTISSDGTESSYDSAKGIHYGTGSAAVGYIQLSTSDIVGTIAKVVVNASTASGVTATVGVSVGGSAFGGEAQSISTTPANYTFTGSAEGNIIVTVTKPNSATGALYVKSVKVYYVPSTDPVINAPNPEELAYNATAGEFNYSITNPTSATLSAASNSDWITDVVVDGSNSKVTFSTSANTNTTQRTGTITLSYTGATDKVVTITQAAAPVIYTTIPALFAAATSTETEVKVTFNNWVVSGVSTNGKNVFVTDNAGNGFVIFSSSDQSGTYAVDNILSGTAITCNLVLFNGYAEIKNLDASDLTINTGGTVTAANIAMADLAGVNTGALVSYSDLTCSVDNKYYLSDGTTTLQVYNSLYAFEALIDGEIYNITGIYQQYNNTKEILPRSANDIEKVTEPIDPTIPDYANTEVAYGSTHTIDDSGIVGGSISVSSSNTAVATVSGLVITPVAVGTTTITVSTEANTTYNAGSKTFTLTVTAPEGQSTKQTAEPVAIFKETFAKCESTGGNGNDGFATASNSEIGSEYYDNYTDNAGWTLTKGYPANACIKFGGSKANGSATTPSITVENGKTYTLTFKAAPWSAEADKTMTVEVATGGTINDETSVTTSSMTSGEWNEFTYNIVATGTNMILGFRCSANRFFLDEVKITKPGEEVANPTVTTAASGYASYCCEYPINLDGLDRNVKAYAVSANTTTSATFTQLTGTIKGGVPFILKGTPSTEYELTLADASTTVPSGNMLRGTLAPTYVTTEEGAYTNLGLSGGEFKRINSGTIKKNKAYLQVPTSSLSASVKAISITFEDATGIDHTEELPIVDNEAWYDLSGRRISQPTKGLYIHGGKKVFVK